MVQNGSVVEANSSVHNAEIVARSTSASASNDVNGTNTASRYDNFDDANGASPSQSQQRLGDKDEFSELTAQIAALTSLSEPDQRIIPDKPPLPSGVMAAALKDRTRHVARPPAHVVSQYENNESNDNSAFNGASTAMAHHANGALARKGSGGALAQQHAQPVTMRASRSAMEVRTHASAIHTSHTFSASSSSSSGSAAGAMVVKQGEEESKGQIAPPPLPPKRKNGRVYDVICLIPWLLPLL